MDTTQLQRQQIIRQAVLKQPDAIVATSLQLWQNLSQEIISIVGEGGFQSMYVRSLHLAVVRFPWLPLPAASGSISGSGIVSGASGTARFAALAESLTAQSPQDAAEGSIALLCTFIDTLALLIGEHLMSRILRSAWGDAALHLAVKEPPQ